MDQSILTKVHDSAAENRAWCQLFHREVVLGSVADRCIANRYHVMTHSSLERWERLTQVSGVRNDAYQRSP